MGMAILIFVLKNLNFIIQKGSLNESDTSTPGFLVFISESACSVHSSLDVLQRAQIDCT